MKEAAVIIIGNEILLGRVTDTNSGFIARTLDPYGISVDTIVTVGDDGEAIADAVRRLTAVYPLVLT
ncbi:MAG: molybdopterin-binding protein, partial [Muribaculaceae bacterium]